MAAAVLHDLVALLLRVEDLLENVGIAGQGFDPALGIVPDGLAQVLCLVRLNLVWFVAVERRCVLALPDSAKAGPGAKISAALSLLLWLAIIIAGRLLPSFEGDGRLFAPLIV
ncbi:MAG TPA: hypothetical protein VIA80_09870 [Hyphomonadaceae bacterium]